MTTGHTVQPKHDDERIACEIETLLQAVDNFHEFLSELTPCQQSRIASGLAWGAQTADVWIDFVAWVRTALHALHRPELNRQSH